MNASGSGKRGLLASILVLLIVFLASSRLALFASSSNSVIGETRIGLLAVSGSRGAVVPADIIVYSSGDCSVVVEPEGLVAVDTVASTEVAFLYASLLAGVDPCSIGVRVVFHTSERVSGPSASGFIARAIYAILRSRQVLENTTMTGAISLTGLVLPVEGIPQKAMAAREAGYSTIIVPVGEVPLNLSGVRVEEACSVLFPMANASSLQMAPSEDLWQQVFRETAERLIAALNTTSQRLGVADHSMLREASRAYRLRDFYSAASLAFTGILDVIRGFAKKQSNSSRLVEKLVLESLGYRSLSGLESDARRAISAASPWRQGGYVDLWALEAKAQALMRFFEAEDSINSTSLVDRVYGLLRFYSVLGWASLAKRVRGPLVERELVEERLRILDRYVDAGLRLAASIYKGHAVVMPDGSKPEDWLREARVDLERGRIEEAYARYSRLFSVLESLLSSILLASSPERGYYCAKPLLEQYWALCPSCMNPSSVLLLEYSERLYEENKTGAALSIVVSALTSTFTEYLETARLSQRIVVGESPRVLGLGGVYDAVVLAALLSTSASLAAVLASLIKSRRVFSET